MGSRHSKERHQYWYEDHDDPCAFMGLRGRDDEEHDASDESAETTDGGAGLPSGTTQSLPMNNHAALRQGEREEHADHVERDQCVGVAREDDNQECGKCAEAQNAVRKRQSITLVHELARQVAIAVSARHAPIPTIASRLTMKKYVGAAKI